LNVRSPDCTVILCKREIFVLESGMAIEIEYCQE